MSAIEEFLSSINSSLLVLSYNSHQILDVGQDGVQHTNAHGRVFSAAVRTDDAGVVSDVTLSDFSGAIHTLVPVPLPNGQNDLNLFLASSSPVTESISRAHELAWAGDELLIAAAGQDAVLDVHPITGQTRTVWTPPSTREKDHEGPSTNLNGLAVRDGKLTHVTVFTDANGTNAWRGEALIGAGQLIDVETDEVVLKGLTAPHSPTWVGDTLWVCNAGQGQVVTPAKDGSMEVIATLPGFTRGIIALDEDTALVGTSTIRGTVVDGFPIAENDNTCAVHLVHRDGTTTELLHLDVPEITDLALLPNTARPLLVFS